MKIAVAVKMFGNKVKIAKAVGFVPQAVTNWKDPLTFTVRNHLLAACVRHGIDPTPLLEAEKEDLIAAQHAAKPNDPAPKPTTGLCQDASRV